MFILGIDTSGVDGSIALARADESFAVLEVVPLAGRTYSAQLIPALAQLLEQHKLTKKDLSAFAIATGPGSFTGLRVGLSAVKALAEVLHAPIAAVSVLEAIAAQTNAGGGRVLAAIDAGRKEVFIGEYELHGGRPRCLRESLLNQVQLAALLEANAAAELITPHATVAELATMHLHLKQIEWPDAGEIARLGFGKIQAGETVSPEGLDANYIRRSDAEIFSRSS